MVDDNSNPSEEKHPNFNRIAVETKLRQAVATIEMALEDCREERLQLIHTCISCAHSYLIEASDKTGRKRR